MHMCALMYTYTLNNSYIYSQLLPSPPPSFSTFFAVIPPQSPLSSYLHCGRAIPLHRLRHVLGCRSFAPLQHVAQVKLSVGGAERGARMATIGGGSALGEGGEG
jgi:hypothetical protein